MASMDLDCPPPNRQSSDLNGSLPTEVLIRTELQPGTSSGLDTIRAQSEDLASLEELLRGSSSAPGPGQSALLEKTQNSFSDASTLPPPLADTVLIPISDLQTESSEGALEDIGLRLSDKGKEMVETGNGHDRDGDGRDENGTAKRTADNASLNEGSEGVPWSEKIRCIDPIDAIDDADEAMSDLEFARFRSLPTPVFRMPPSWRDFQEHKNTTSLSSSNGAGDSQDDPFVIDDGDEKVSESGAFTRATSVEPETGMAHLFNSLRREELKTLGSLDTPTAPDPSVEPLDQPTSPDVALPQHRVQTEDKAEEEAITEPNLIPSCRRSRDPVAGQAEVRREPTETQDLGNSAASGDSAKRDQQNLRSGTDDEDDDIRPPKKRSAGKPLVVHNEEPDSITPKAGHADDPAGVITPDPTLKGATEWEIKRITGKRRTGREWEYKVVWANTWVPRRDLGNARRLLREFESKA